MTKLIFIIIFSLICFLTAHCQAVYVDSNNGDDKNSGTKNSPVYSIHKAMEIISSKDNDIYTVKINPGIYILERHIDVETKKDMNNKRIVIEAAILPDDTAWMPNKMPVIKSIAKTGEIMLDTLFIKDNWITGFYINENHVTIRGLKFTGYDYPVNFYYPISRFNKERSGLHIEQCMFTADLQSSVIQAGIIAHGDSVKVDHCVFYGVNNAIVYWQDTGNGFKTGNSFTNSIVEGTAGCAVWTDTPDKDFVFKNNIITNCKFVWITGHKSPEKYIMENCVAVNNEIFKAFEDLQPTDFPMNEINVIKDGNVSLRMIKAVFEPWPVDHLHVMPNTPGYNIGAGLFKSRKVIN